MPQALSLQQSVVEQNSRAELALASFQEAQRVWTGLHLPQTTSLLLVSVWTQPWPKSHHSSSLWIFLGGGGGGGMPGLPCVN